MTRYSRRPFPPYRHRPGRTPHPERHPEGHMRAAVESDPRRLTEESWKGNEDYLYGIDLFNAEYWWEAHEVWEGLWRLETPGGTVALLLQGLIQLAAARLKENLGELEGAEKLNRAALSKLRFVPRFYMGLDLDGVDETTSHLELSGV